MLCAFSSFQSAQGLAVSLLVHQLDRGSLKPQMLFYLSCCWTHERGAITFEPAFSILYSKGCTQFREVRDWYRVIQLVPLFRIELILSPVFLLLHNLTPATPGSSEYTTSPSEGPLPSVWEDRYLGARILLNIFQPCTMYTYSFSSLFSLGTQV